MSAINLEKMIDAAEASRLTGLSPNTILVYAKNGKLPFVKIGAWRYRFDKKDILNLVKPHNAQEQLD